MSALDITAVEAWLQQHETWLEWLGIITVILLIWVAISVPRVVARIPADYFAHEKRNEMRQGPRSLSSILLTLLKNAAGSLIVLAGIAMLVLPGSGTVTILLGVVIMDFPGKYKIERAIVQRAAVLKALNDIRAKAGVPPLQMGPEAQPSVPAGS